MVNFKFGVNAAWRAHRFPGEEILEMFVTGIKHDLFRKEIHSRKRETSQEAMDESRAKLSTYRDILDITDLVNKADVTKEKRDPPFSHDIVKI